MTRTDLYFTYKKIIKCSCTNKKVIRIDWHWLLLEHHLGDMLTWLTLDGSNTRHLNICRNIQDSTREIFHHFLIATNSLIKVSRVICTAFDVKGLKNGRFAQCITIVIRFWTSIKSNKSNFWLKAAHLETVKDRTVKEVNTVVARVHNTYDDLQTYTNMALVSIFWCFCVHFRFNVVLSSWTLRNFTQIIMGLVAFYFFSISFLLHAFYFKQG